jgi:hypothetical protein
MSACSPRAHRSEKLTTGHSVLYSHFFVFVGLSILASLIRHAILDDVVESDFRVLSAIGAVCFAIGKQYAYFMERGELRERPPRASLGAQAPSSLPPRTKKPPAAVSFVSWRKR